MQMINKSLYTEKKAILNTSIKEEEMTSTADGEVILKVDKYALTSNNVTYAVIGYQVKYWDFFPAPEPWGKVPVWGFATVEESKCEGVEVGEKVYGYFPMSQYLKIKAGKVNQFSFMDISEHRQALAPIYNTYSREGEILNFPEGVEDFIPITKPLFMTSFSICEFLHLEDFFTSENVIITSASSKTSLGLAYTLKNIQKDHNKNVIGLTSTRNVEFVKETGLYNQVIDYKDVAAEVPSKDSVMVDMAGNGKLNLALYEQLGERLKHLCKVGLTDWSSANMESKIPVARFFFAPTYAQGFFKKHGPAKGNEITTKALYSFIETASKWIDLEYLSTFEDLQSTFTAMISGKVDPSKGYIIKS